MTLGASVFVRGNAQNSNSEVTGKSDRGLGRGEAGRGPAAL